LLTEDLIAIIHLSQTTTAICSHCAVTVTLVETPGSSLSDSPGDVLNVYWVVI